MSLDHEKTKQFEDLADFLYQLESADGSKAMDLVERFQRGELILPDSNDLDTAGHLYAVSIANRPAV